jgi:hypothetical protein
VPLVNKRVGLRGVAVVRRDGAPPRSLRPQRLEACTGSRSEMIRVDPAAGRLECGGEPEADAGAGESYRHVGRLPHTACPDGSDGAAGWSAAGRPRWGALSLYAAGVIETCGVDVNAGSAGHVNTRPRTAFTSSFFISDILPYRPISARTPLFATYSPRHELRRASRICTSQISFSLIAQ